LSKDPTGKVKKKRLETIPGIVPNLLHLPQGCRFQERCSFVLDQCKQQEPELRKIATQVTNAQLEHTIRCVRDI
jgi:oligopeptide/dipeptide ABC transporter ATP-binding protein